MAGEKNPNYKPKVIKNCLICGKTIVDSPKHAETHNFCSRECRAIYQSEHDRGKKNPFYGKTHTQKTKAAVSKANTGRPQSEATRKKRSESCKKVEHTEEWRNNQSKALMGREITWNDKVSAGRQGVSMDDREGFVTPLHTKIRSSPEYAAWRTAIFECDDYRD